MNGRSDVSEQFWNESCAVSAAVGGNGGANQGKNGLNGGFVGYQNFFDMRQYQGAGLQSVSSNPGAGLVGSGSNQSSPQTGDGILKKRVARACDHCRRRKIKCDTVNPETQKCSNCTKYNAQCTFKVREDVERRRKGCDVVEMAETGPETLNVLNFAPGSSATESGTQLGIYPEDQMSFQRSNERMASPDLSGRVEKLDRKVSSICKSLKDVQSLLTELVGRKGKVKGTPELPKPKIKRYYTTILTPQILIWADKRLNTYGTEKSIMSPINELLTITLKWQMIEKKALTDFSAPMIRNGKFQLHPLPPRAQAKRIMENIRSAMLVSSAPGLVTADYYASLIDEFYSGKPLSYAELLLLHVSISFGAARMRILNPGDSYTLRKDRYDPSKEELQTIEYDCLLNAIYYYNKVSISGPSLTATQGLMLLSLHLRESRDSSLAFGVFTTAVKFAFDLGLHQRVSYLNLTLEEEIIRRTVWWHCANTDKWFALTQSRPALIKEQDMDLLSDHCYFDYMKTLLRLKGPSVAQDVEKLTDLQSCLDYVINYCDLLPTYVSYFSLKLTRIEGRVAQHCFSVRSTMDSSIDEIIDKLLHLREELNDWDDNLHPSMQLSSYKSYLSLLYVRDAAENPALTYEVACSRVVRCHFRSMHARILLGLFASSFLVDNVSLLKGSRHAISSIYRLFVNDTVEICMKMLRVFITVEYEGDIYTGLLYCLLTGVFTLILYIIKYSEEEDTHKLTEILDLLISSHSHLIGENEEYLISDNPKWNTSIFFYTILLSATIQYCQDLNLDIKYYAFNLERYNNMLTRIINHSSTIKNRSLDSLVFYTRCFKLMEDQAILSDGSERKSVSKDIHASTRLLCPSFFSLIGMEEDTLTFFRCSEPFEVSAKPNPGYKGLEHQIFTNGSLFRISGPNFLGHLESFGIESSSHGIKNQNSTVNGATDVNDRSNDVQELFYPYALFYDRDLFFSNLLAEVLVLPK
ncbi:hypothetical protein HG537_0D02700 [Torulaspora globosa]|uniref:Zn(2)-C6 fungal-type domain-containing protein n=1 Tax=Torulaspora globosa TaxID=48254 RepID=A0A7H9HSI5_9SACH|nr:hypothetical protein HG537_0D02700 [Torulaspora sp. CBS 2947]